MDLSPELKSLLARLCVSDSATNTFATVAEERAFVNDLVAVVGAEVAFRALAKHINDFTSTTTYGSTSDTVYPGQTYTNFNGHDILLAIGNGVLTQGQDIALAMFIRANIPLSEMTKVISHANLLAYIELRASSTTSSAGTSKPIVEGTGNDFTTALHLSRRYQYDVSQFFSANGTSSFKFGKEVSNDDIMFIISKSALYTAAADAATSTTMAAKTIALKMISQLVPISLNPNDSDHPLRSAQEIGAGFKAVTASSSGFYYAGPNYTASNGITFSRSSTISYLATATHVIEYVTSSNGKKTHTLPSSVDSYYLPTSSFTFNLNITTTNGDYTINGDKLISNDSLSKYSVSDLLGFGLSTLEIKGLDKDLSAIITGVSKVTPSSPFTPTRALTDGWTLNQVITAYPALKDLTEGGSKFNAVNVTPAGANSSDNFKLVSLYDPDAPNALYTTELINKLVTMYNALPTTNAFVTAINDATRYLPGYVANTSSWSTANNLTASIARWIYTTTTPQMAAGHIVGKMSIAALKRLLPTGLSEQDIVKESELATYANGAITSGLSPETLIAAPYNLTPKAALDNGWPLALLMNSFSAQALLVKTLTNGTLSSAITLTQALIGREWVSNTSPAASLNKSVDNISFKTIKSIKNTAGLPIYSDDDILDAIRNYMSASGNGLTSGNILAFLSALHLPFAVVRKLVRAQYGPSSNPSTVSKANIAALKDYTKSQRRSVYSGIVDAISSLTRDEITTADFVALGWPVSDWEDYARNPNGVTITISLRDLLGAFEPVSVFDPDSFLITGATMSIPTDQRAIYHTKAERVALVRLFTGKVNPEAAREVEALALGPLEDLDEITL